MDTSGGGDQSTRMKREAVPRRSVSRFKRRCSIVAGVFVVAIGFRRLIYFYLEAKNAEPAIEEVERERGEVESGRASHRK